MVSPVSQQKKLFNAFSSGMAAVDVAYDILSSTGRSPAQIDQFFSNSSYQSSIDDLMSVSAIIANAHPDAKALGFAKKNKLVCEEFVIGIGYHAARGYEIMFDDNGYVFTDNNMNNLVRRWIGKRELDFYDQQNISNHPAKGSTNYQELIKDLEDGRKSMNCPSVEGPIQEEVNSAGQLVLSQAFYLNDQFVGNSYYILNSEGRNVEQKQVSCRSCIDGTECHPISRRMQREYGEDGTVLKTLISKTEPGDSVNIQSPTFFKSEKVSTDPEGNTTIEEVCNTNDGVLKKRLTLDKYGSVIDSSNTQNYFKGVSINNEVYYKMANEAGCPLIIYGVDF